MCIFQKAFLWFSAPKSPCIETEQPDVFPFFIRGRKKVEIKGILPISNAYKEHITTGDRARVECWSIRASETLRMKMVQESEEIRPIRELPSVFVLCTLWQWLPTGAPVLYIKFIRLFEPTK